MFVIQAITSKKYYREFDPIGVDNIKEATRITEEMADKMIARSANWNKGNQRVIKIDVGDE